jgi:hypothetical protein
MMPVRNNVKEYCEKFGYKLEKIINENEFITSKKVDVKAGMKYLLGTDKLISIPIKKIGVKLVFEKHLCFSDGDIVVNGFLNYSKIKDITSYCVEVKCE